MKLDQVYKDRLELVCKKLDTISPDRFDFSHWVGNDWQGMPDLSCQTTACALGWSTTIPELRDLGLRMQTFENGFRGGFPTITPVGEKLNFAQVEAEQAAFFIFGLGKNAFEYLFMPWEIDSGRAEDLEDLFGYPPLKEDATAKELSEHIRLFISEH